VRLASVRTSVPWRALVLLPLLLAWTGCQDRADWAAEQGILILGNGAEPKALDPHLVSSVGDSNIMAALFEGLVSYHPSDDTIDVPGVAKEWLPNEDFTVWTFSLREDAKWSNGDPVTAHDFVYAYERILTPDLASPYASMLYFLRNAKKFNRGELEDFSQVGVKALDDFTLRCELVAPTAYFPSVVKHTTWLPVHRPTIEKHGAMAERFTAWQKPGNHVGNGPFQLESWRVNHSVIVEPNPHYWDRERVTLKEIRFLPLDQFPEERCFRDGLLHVTYVLPSNLIDDYRENRPEVFRSEPYAGVYFYRCNTRVKPLDDPRVRKALAFSIDQKAIVENITMGGQVPAYGFTPPTERGYRPPNRVRYDPGRARELLAEAGYPGGEGFPEIELLFNTSEAHRPIAEAIQNMWKRNLGIETIDLENQEWKVFQQTVFEEEYEISRAGWIADYLDPTTFLDMWRKGDSNNNTGWSHPDYDRLLREAALEADPQSRRRKLQAAEEILLEEMPVLPIYWYTRTYAIHPAVKNWDPLVLDRRDYKFIRLVP